MANISITRTKVLPDTGTKDDLHDLIDTAIATISDINGDDIGQITTATKVSGYSVYNLSCIPSVAGYVPNYNMFTSLTSGCGVRFNGVRMTGYRREFKELDDTPSSYSGLGGRYLAITTGENGVEARDLTNVTTGHDHDGTDSKKVIAINLDPTGVTDGHFLKRSGSSIVGAAGVTDYNADTYAASRLVTADVERSVINNTNYTKVKEIVCNANGTFYFQVDMKTNNAGRTAYAKIYRNGTPVGNELTVAGSETYLTRSDSVGGWSSGDLIQLYIKTTGDEQTFIRNFRVFGTQFTINTD